MFREQILIFCEFLKHSKILLRFSNASLVFMGEISYSRNNTRKIKTNKK